jgi:glycosyltransferase involved in cell wall biosynthesis
VSALVEAGFRPVEVRYAARNPLGTSHVRRIVRSTGATATLSPLYLTLHGAARNLATVFDLTGRTHPRTLASRLLWEITVRRTLRLGSTIICATASSARELESRFPSARGRTAIVSGVAPTPSSGAPDQLARWGVFTPYVLAVASHRPHKRLAALARAWSSAGSGIPLLLAGAGTQELHRPPAVRALGFVTDDTVGALLASASCLVSASVAEGFGLPVLAAMAAGVPVVASRQPALCEVAGDAGLWLEPEDIAGLVRAAVLLAADPESSAHRIACGRARAREFSAASAAHQLAGLLC